VTHAVSPGRYSNPR